MLKLLIINDNMVVSCFLIKHFTSFKFGFLRDQT